MFSTQQESPNSKFNIEKQKKSSRQNADVDSNIDKMHNRVFSLLKKKKMKTWNNFLFLIELNQFQSTQNVWAYIKKSFIVINSYGFWMKRINFKIHRTNNCLQKYWYNNLFIYNLFIIIHSKNKLLRESIKLFTFFLVNEIKMNKRLC